jgi:hypothetical protein
MQTFIIILLLVLAFVAGNALLLLRTAKPPHIPEGVKPQPYTDDDTDAL